MRDRAVTRSGSIPRGVLAALAAALLAMTAAVWFGGVGRDGAGGPTGPGEATVVRVVDGDTLVVRLAGSDERVRVLGIDTPETHHPDKPVECFGPEASARTSELVAPGTVVRLERDVELHDRHGRLLAHVVRAGDGLRLGNTLVEEGYADTLRIPPNTSLSGELSEARDRAREARRGMWGSCGAGDDR